MGETPKTALAWLYKPSLPARTKEKLRVLYQIRLITCDYRIRAKSQENLFLPAPCTPAV